MQVAFTLPHELFSATGGSNLAIDFGGSVIKVVHLTATDDGKSHRVQVTNFARLELDKFLDFLRGLRGQVIGEVYTTGIGIEEYRQQITESLGGNKLQLLMELTCFVDCFRSMVRMLPKNEIVYEVDRDCVTESEDILKATRGTTSHFSRFLQNRIELPLGDPDLPADFYKWTEVAVEPGVPYIQGDPGLYPSLLVILGSAAPIIKMESSGRCRLLDTNSRCGRSILAMASLFMGVKDFGEIVRLAEKGDSSKVNTVMSDFGGQAAHDTTEEKPKGAGRNIQTEADKSQGDGNRPLTNKEEEEMGYQKGMRGDLILYTYGKGLGRDLDSFSREDIMRAIVCHVVQDLAHGVALTAKGHEVHRVFFAGSLITHSLIREELTRCLSFQKISYPKVEYNFLLHGGHYGAIGALLGSRETDNTPSA